MTCLPDLGTGDREPFSLAARHFSGYTSTNLPTACHNNTAAKKSARPVTDASIGPNL